MNLKISKDLTLPAETVTQKLAWLGTTGSGKTYGASKMAEEMFAVGAQFVVLDPVGVWYGLRLAKDGKKPSNIDIPIFGGLHGDVPLESSAGELMANLVVDKDLSCVLDVSQFESDAEKARFAAAFANRFFFRKKAAPSAVHLFLEECQEFVPQNPQRGEEQMLHAFIRMQKLGRNFGIGSSYITQRPQEVSKKALNMAQTLFVFRTTGTHERNAIEKWIEDKSLDQSIANDLPKILTGNCHVWSPEFLKISNMVKISEKHTFNASATPEVGVTAKARQLAPIDLKKIHAEMVATIEKAKSEDPKALRKRVAELERELAKKPEPKIVKTGSVKIQKIEVPTVGKKTLEQLKKSETAMRKSLKGMQTIQLQMGLYVEDYQKGLEKFSRDLLKIANPMISVPAAAVPLKPWREPVHPAPKEKDKEAVYDGHFVPGKSQQKILDALAWFEAFGLKQVNKTQLAFIADQKPTSGNYQNNLSVLRVAGLIDYPIAGSVSLTDRGSILAHATDAPATQEELHRQVKSKISSSQWTLLQILIEIYPEAISKNELAERAAVQITSGNYQNNLSVLRTLGVIDYPSPGMVVALPILFIDA